MVWSSEYPIKGRMRTNWRIAEPVGFDVISLASRRLVSVNNLYCKCSALLAYCQIVNLEIFLIIRSANNSKRVKAVFEPKPWYHWTTLEKFNWSPSDSPKKSVDPFSGLYWTNHFCNTLAEVFRKAGLQLMITLLTLPFWFQFRQGISTLLNLASFLLECSQLGFSSTPASEVITRCTSPAVISGLLKNLGLATVHQRLVWPRPEVLARHYSSRRLIASYVWCCSGRPLPLLCSFTNVQP